MSQTVGGSYVPNNSYNRAGAIDRNVSPQGLVTTLAGDGPIPVLSASIWIAKGSAAALSLPAPTAAQVGTEIQIIAGTNFAHVLTATGLIDNGTTAGPHNTWTSAAFVGSSLTVVAMPNLRWSVVGQILGAIA